MSETQHYLQKELYSLLGDNPDIFGFVKKSILDGIWFWDLENPENEWMSERFWETLGYAPEEKQHLYSEWYSLVYPEDVIRCEENLARCLNDPEEKFDQIVRYRHKEGYPVWIRCRALIIRNQEGKPIRMLGIHIDISRLMSLQLENEIKSEIIEAIPNPVFIKDREYRYTSCNRAFADFLGKPIAEILGVGVYDLNPEKLARLYNEKDSELFEGKAEIQIYQATVHTARGEKEVIFNKRVIVDSRGERIGIIGLITDTTELKKKQRELEVAVAQAEAANQAKNNFLANMSHEIRTPLNGIMGMLQLLEMSKLQPDQEEYVRICRTSAELLLEVLKDILDFSKLAEGKLELGKQIFSLEDLIRDMQGLFSATAREKGLAYAIFSDKEIPGILYGSPFRIRQVLANLLGNAFKFTRKGEVILEIKLIEEREEEVELLFRVRDTGKGIPDEILPLIFEKFYQAEGQNLLSHSGSGLGLAISKALVELMGGEIYVKSKAEEGSEFSFKIALQKREVE